VKEALRSDGTAFTVVSDANISAGLLLTNGQPKYPIVISLASEAISDDEIAQFTNYVAAGGTLFIGSSAFTRNTNGTTRGDFAFSNEMGIHMVNASLQNWANNSTFTKTVDHRIVSHIPGGGLTWQMPRFSEEVPTGISPDHSLPNVHGIWQVQPTTNAVVLAQGDLFPYLLVRQYGKGNFVYDAAMQPLLGHSSWAPGMYAYVIFRRAIEWAFESSKLPVPKVSPWPYPYDAALNVRHDFENTPSLINSIEASAQFEASLGVKGDYFFCTGTLRQEMTNSPATIASLQRAVTNYGATIGPHNGGLKNPNNPSLVLSNYDYWHWGPDEAYDSTNTLPPGYTNWQHYAATSVSNAFSDVDGWLFGITNGGGIRHTVAPNFNATREASYQIEEALGVRTTGEQKLGPFPSWVLSTSLSTAGKRYPFISLPVSDWYLCYQTSPPFWVSQSMETIFGHTPGTVRELVDFYYDLGGLINAYSHNTSLGGGTADNNPREYVTYAVTKPRIWLANASSVYSWWVARTNAQITPVFTTNGNQSIITLALAGVTDANSAVEVLLPHPSVSGLQVFTNGILASGSSYRTNGQVVKILAGPSVLTAEVRYTLNPKAVGDVYSVPAATNLIVAAPGVLTNDEVGVGTNLTAALVSGASHGTLTLNTNGGFTYSPNANFTGTDSFTYQANDGVATSDVATATITVTPAGEVFFDDFTRAANAEPLAPWIPALGDWTITNGILRGASSGVGEYADAYVAGNWSDFSL